MKRKSKRPDSHRPEADVAGEAPRVGIRSQVLRDMRQHARSSMNAEICGVLIGTAEQGKTFVEASIQGEEARQGGSHVTFTQDTWTHIYQVKDSKYPDKRIVGWYHSHPGFGIFLSEHDTFIHRNFFSDASQIAWVYDPHSDEEGCFAWMNGEIQRLAEITIRDEPGESALSDHPRYTESFEEQVELPQVEAGSRRGRIVRSLLLVLSHLFLLILGLAAGALLAPQVILVPDTRESRPAQAAPTAPPGHPTPAEEGRKK